MARTIEHEADTVEEATTRALDELGAHRDAVDVEVLDEGKRSFIGLGGRAARVRVTLRERDTMETNEHETQIEDEQETPDAVETGEPADVAGAVDDVNGEESEPKADTVSPEPEPRKRRRRLDGRDGVPSRSRRPRKVKRDKPADVPPRQPEAPAVETPPRQPEASTAERSQAPRPERPKRAERPKERPEPEEREERPERKPRERPKPREEKARPAPQEREEHSDDGIVREPADVVGDLLEFMGFEAEVTATDREEAVQVNIDCDDTNLLIGKHGQNIDSLQYIASRICNFGRNDPFPMLIDVADYRSQREETLENLAFSLADKVVRSGRPISLEPLPAMERRIIHLALKEDEDVETYSRGEADERYVVIGPKRGRGRR